MKKRVKKRCSKGRAFFRRKGVRIAIGLLILVVIGWLAFKAFLVYLGYRVTEDPIIKFRGTITLNQSNTCDVSFKGFSMCVPDGFALTNVWDDIVHFRDLEKRDIMGGKYDITLEDDILDIDSDIDAEEFMKKYHFSTRNDVIHYYVKHQNDQFPLFSKISDVKDYYTIWKLVNVILPEGDLYYIDGDYEGYLIKQKNFYLFYLYDGDFLYSISFRNTDLKDNYFNDDNVFSIVSSVRFED